MEQDDKYTVVSNGYEVESSSMNLRFLGKNGTTTAPRILQQQFEIRRYENSGKMISRRIEWRGVPLHLED